jgi:tRNA(adenine34) deaminase
MGLDYSAFMLECLELARVSASLDEVPVGALVLKDGVVIGRGSNLRESQHSVVGHAEIQALQMASSHLQSWRLNGCILVSSLEPCVMCAGAIIQSRISTLVYGASDEKGGAQSLFQVFDSPRLNHRVEVVSGVLADEAALLLKEFFKNKR